MVAPGGKRPGDPVALVDYTASTVLLMAAAGALR